MLNWKTLIEYTQKTWDSPSVAAVHELKRAVGLAPTPGDSGVEVYHLAFGKIHGSNLEIRQDYYTCSAIECQIWRPLTISGDKFNKNSSKLTM